MSSLFFAVKGCMQGAPEQVAPGEWEASFAFDASFAGFNGHFPGNPVVPGIVQIMAVTLTAAPGADANLQQIGRSKFLSMVVPGDVMRVRAKTARIGDSIRVTADCATQNGPCSQLKLVLGV